MAFTVARIREALAVESTAAPTAPGVEIIAGRGTSTGGA